VVSRPADQLWGPVREFWQENGFLLTLDQANLGIMETDWAENRAKLPQDFIRNALGKVFDSLYSTGERDRFRTRLERNAAGSTEIYISHRGMIEVYNNTQKDQTVWQPRATDPELEAEFLRRLMVAWVHAGRSSRAPWWRWRHRAADRPAWPWWATTCRWCRSTKALTAPGAGSA
jgi:outer membrane protein assembly factor BamC